MIEVDLDFLESFEPRSRQWATQVVARLARWLGELGPDTPRSVEGAEILRRPVILATNHTHVLDFLPLWIELLDRGEQMVGLVKARMYKSLRNRALMRFLGNNLPIVSRGYLIAADFYALMGRRPTDEEYRYLRDHLDYGRALPGQSPYRRVITTRRRILGRMFWPDQESYRAAMCDLFYRMMQTMVDGAAVYVEQGHHIHIYPEGQVSQHLTAGHPGVVHLALALDLPVVPVGISGCDQAFVANTPLTRGKEIRIRVGEPIDVDSAMVGSDFRPFHPIDQHRHREVLQEEVDEIMDRLDALVDAPYGFAPQIDDQITSGVRRFY